MTVLFLGVDLAWSEGTSTRHANESGVACLDSSGRILDAGWTVGLDATVEWITTAAGADDCLLAVDAPLVVTNETGQRLCETQVGQRYGRWNVSANTTNTRSPRLAGVALLRSLSESGWSYTDGWDGSPTSGRRLFECYPYTAIVGAEELGYDRERPRYKRQPKGVRVAAWRPVRAAACDELISRIDSLSDADPPLRLASNSVTEQLTATESPADNDVVYKHREDLIDALLCAWTASLWFQHGESRCQVLGEPPAEGRRVATIIAPARPAQRRS